MKLGTSIEFPGKGKVNNSTDVTLIEINSKDRYNGTSANFNYNFKQIGRENVTSIRVNKTTIPYSYYNTREQTFTVTIDEEPPVLINFPAGSYTPLTLSNQLLALINPTVSQPVTITFNQNTNKFTVSVANPHTISINFSNVLSQPTTSGNSLINYNIGHQMGFINLILPTTQSHTSDIVVNLNATVNIYISSNSLTSYMQSYFNTNKSNIIQAVPIQVNSFNYIVWENQQDTTFAFDNGTINQFDLKLLDDYGNILDLNGNNWTMELQLA